MYKKLALNSSLVLVLSFLFALPFLGFGFATYDETSLDESMVLGANNFSPNVKKSEPMLEVYDQIDLEVNLNAKDKAQLIYDVLPKKYQGNEYKRIVILPKEVSYSGVSLEEQIGQDGASLNFMFTISNDENPILNFPVSLLIYKLN
jgi:hypothetical protein